MFLPNHEFDTKLSKWINSLCAAIISKDKLFVTGQSKAEYSELDQYNITEALDQFCGKNERLILIVPQNLDLNHLLWLNPDYHRLIVYGFEKTDQSMSILLNICNGIVWMDNLPDTIHTTIPTYEITARSKVKWRKFVDHDWWQSKLNPAALEFCNMQNNFTTQLHDINRKYEQHLDSIQSIYREEIKAWSQASSEKKLQPKPLEQSEGYSSSELTNSSLMEKKLHAKEVYIQDLETRLGRYENQTLYVIWHQLKQFFKVIVIRLPLTLCLLGYHIFSTYYHRYQSSNKQL